MKKAPANIRFAAIAVDIVVFGMAQDELSVLLDTVDRPPHYTNISGFPGGLIETHETALDAVHRHLKTKVGLEDVYIEQLYTFSDIERDKRNRVVSIGYVGLVRPRLIESYTHERAVWAPVHTLPKLAYDHNEMARVALDRLKGKLTYTTIAQFLLPKQFTLSELQRVYETVLQTTLDKRNFRKKVISLDILAETGKMQEGVKNRPAALYQFKQQTVQELPLFV